MVSMSLGSSRTSYTSTLEAIEVKEGEQFLFAGLVVQGLGQYDYRLTAVKVGLCGSSRGHTKNTRTAAFRVPEEPEYQ